MMKPKKIPQRMCLGCGGMFDKRTLIRAVKNKEGEISLDFTGRAPGRGAYLCKNAECLRRAIKGRKLERAFGVAIPDEVYARLEAELSGHE